MSKKERWKPSNIDKGKVEEKVRMAQHYLSSLENGIKRGSILADLDYGYVHEAVEELYTICDIGSLAADNADRDRKVKKNAR